jgi:hypothetical protein
MAQTNSKNKLVDRQSILSSLALGCSLLVLLLLGARQFTSYDLGYHLAFGQTFFDTDTIVDYTPFIYTLPALDTSVANRPSPGPGCWYDDLGRYRFPNANWLSQLFIYCFWRIGGVLGLNLFQLLMVSGLSAFLIIAMRRSQLPLPLISLSLLLVGVIISSRLNMRPELFGYLCLITQYTMLVRLSMETDKPVPPSWTWVGGMIAVQLLAINVHSYFLLGLAITATVLTEYILHALKKRFVDKDTTGFQAYKKVISRLFITISGMVLISFVNPWGWRLALLPIQTLLYMKKHGIGGSTPGEGMHPWNHILEFRGTISGHWPTRLSDYAFIIILVLATAAVISQLALIFAQQLRENYTKKNTTSYHHTMRIRWAHLFMICGMLLVGLQMRRNIGVASLIIVPSALLSIRDSCRYFLSGKFARVPPKLFTFANAAVIAFSLFGGYQIVSGKIYEADALPTHFGFGLSESILPIGASKWLNDYAPGARIWCDFQTSSTLHFFTRPHKEVPILTNTWAYPPEVMASNIFYLRATVPFSILADKYSIDAVVLRSDWSLPLHRQLGADPEWKMVQVEGVNVLYLRTNPKFTKLATEHEIRLGNFNVDSFVKEQIHKDPSFKRALLGVSDTLKEAGELDLAIDVIETGLKYLPPGISTWKKLLDLYNNREAQRRESGDKRCIDDLIRMKYLIERILALEPNNQDLRKQLEVINRVSSLLNSQS